MTMRRRGPVRALVAPAVAVVVALGPMAAALVPATAAATPLPTADQDPTPIQVTMSSIRPLAPQPGDTETVTGRLRNTTDQTLSGISVQLRMGEAIGSRSEFDTYAAEPDSMLLDDIVDPIAVGPETSPATTLLPGASEPFTATLAIDPDSYDQGLPENAWQVRPLGVEAYDATNPDASAPAGQLKTFLSWAPAAAPAEQPTRVAWVWPLVDVPHHTVTGGWADDALAPELEAGGRLTDLLTAAADAETQRPLGASGVRDVRVTWAIDPMLVSDIASMAAGYQVTTGKKTVTGTGTAAAKSWLSELQTAAAGGAAVISLPYGDPDIMAAVRAGIDTIVGAASTTGETILAHLLPAADLLKDGWPPNGYANQAGLNALTALGETPILLNGAALPAPVTPKYTPSARTTYTTNTGPVDVVLSDPTLSNAVQDGASSPGLREVALQRYLAETLMIQSERPSLSRDIVVAPDRRWDPSAAYAKALLADTGRVPWIRSVSLQQVQDDPPDTSVQRRQLTYPPDVRRHELSPDYVHQIEQFRSKVAALTDILPNGVTGQSENYARTEQQALSSGWRSDQALATQRLSAAAATVATQTNQVRITSVTGSYVTLTSHNGKVPVTISNSLDTPVSVDVQVAPNQRLTLSQGGKVPATIPAHLQQTVFISVGAKTSGVFSLQVRLFTPDGSPYGQPVQLFVRSTVYGTVTLLITGAATAALLVAVGIRLGRRALAARRTVAT